MVLLGRIELPTSALPRMRSTTELQQHTISQACKSGSPWLPARKACAYAQVPMVCQPSPVLPNAPVRRYAAKPMEKPPAPPKLTPAEERKARLAANLRENLRRRKAQARAMNANGES
jgi:hypothetical protein